MHLSLAAPYQVLSTFHLLVALIFNDLMSTDIRGILLVSDSTYRPVTSDSQVYTQAHKDIQTSGCEDTCFQQPPYLQAISFCWLMQC